MAPRTGRSGRSEMALRRRRSRAMNRVGIRAAFAAGRIFGAGGALTGKSRIRVRYFPVSLYYFHCTDGDRFIADPLGGAARSLNDVYRLARSIARRTRARDGRIRSWWNWRVDVRDPDGRLVASVPFRGASRSHRALRADPAAR